MMAALDEPLGALIVSLRNNSGNAPSWLVLFNAEANKIAPLIEFDTSRSANALNSAIWDVQGHPYDLQVLEKARRNMIDNVR